MANPQQRKYHCLPPPPPPFLSHFIPDLWLCDYDRGGKSPRRSEFGELPVFYGHYQTSSFLLRDHQRTDCLALSVCACFSTTANGLWGMRCVPVSSRENVRHFHLEHRDFNFLKVVFDIIEGIQSKLWYKEAPDEIPKDINRESFIKIASISQLHILKNSTPRKVENV